MSAFDELLKAVGSGGEAPRDSQTAERIADAVELSSAIAAVHFYEAQDTSSGYAAAARLKKLVGEFTARMCRRHGA